MNEVVDSSYTTEKIVERMKQNLMVETNRLEGGYAMDNIRAVAFELAEIIAMYIEPLIDEVMLDTATSSMLDAKANEYGMLRKGAVAARGEITITGDAGLVVDAGLRVLAGDTEFETTESVTLNASGSATAHVIALEAGLVGNVAQGAINALELELDGIDSVVNASPTVGGVDEEGDNPFRERICQKIQMPITSGNKNQYIYWAKQILGVGKVKVKPLWNGAGTVKIVLLSDTNTGVDNTVINAVVEHIENNRPIGVNVMVVSAQPKIVDLNVNVNFGVGETAESVKNRLISNVNQYFNTIAFADIALSYYKVGDIVFRTEGILDITSYTVNGGNTTITLTDEEYFKLGTVVVNGA